MKIGVDIDDTLNDFTKQLLKFHNEEYETQHTYEDVKHHDLRKLWKVDSLEVYRRIDNFYEDSSVEGITPVSGAQKALEELHKKHEIIAITARPRFTQRGFDVREATYQWVEKYFGKSIEFVRFSSDLFKDARRMKHQICHQEGVDVMVEDNMKYARRCAESGTPVMLVDQPWNPNDNPGEGIVKVGDYRKDISPWAEHEIPLIIRHIPVNPTV